MLIKLVIYHLLLLACLGSAFLRKRWILYATALFLPMVETLPGPYGFVFSPPNAILVGLLGLWAQGARDQEGQRPPVPIKPAIWIWGLALLLGVVRLFLFPSPEAARAIEPSQALLQAWYWMTPFLVFALYFVLVSGRREAEIIVMICMLAASGESLLAVYERLQGVGRATAHLAEANRAGAYFAATSVLFLAFVLLKKGRPRWIMSGAWALAVTALMATLSRGGMLAGSLASTTVFSLFLVQSRQKGASAKLGYIVILILLVTNAALLVPKRVVDRVLFTVQGNPEKLDDLVRVGQIDPEELDGSAAGRLQLWRWGKLLIAERPMGHGAFTSPELMAKYRGSRKAVHNIYLQVLIELGVQGGLAMLVLITSVLLAHWRYFKAAGDVDSMALSLGLLGYWIALCVAHIFLNPFFMLHLNGHFWIMTACVFRQLPPRP